MLNLAKKEKIITVDPKILTAVLSPYHNTQTDYLKQAEIIPSHNLLAASGDFSIPKSCYIDSTGHFNAVEFIICYNQLAYAIFGYGFRYGLFKDIPIASGNTEAGRILSSTSYDNYLNKQLGSTFILRSDLSFKKIINPTGFKGTINIHQFLYRNKTFFVKTSCEFFCESEGKATGQIILAYTA